MNTTENVNLYSGLEKLQSGLDPGLGSVFGPPIKIDFAVYTKQFSKINLKNPLDHVIESDYIIIDEALFKRIFYDSDNFDINPIAYLDNQLLPYIKFSNIKVLGANFSLYDEIIKNIENDLGISISMFSPCTTITLSKEINSIKTLCDLIATGTKLCSLSWSDIKNIIKNDNTENIPTEDTPIVATNVATILTLSVVFSNPTTGVNATIIKFNFAVNISV